MEIDPPDYSDGAPPPNKQQRSDVVNNTGQAESRNVDLLISSTARADRAIGFLTSLNNRRREKTRLIIVQSKIS